jgi:hypothetical protein
MNFLTKNMNFPLILEYKNECLNIHEFSMNMYEFPRWRLPESAGRRQCGPGHVREAAARDSDRDALGEDDTVEAVPYDVGAMSRR